MNSLQQQIETIRKAIEDKTGKEIITLHYNYGKIGFYSSEETPFTPIEIDERLLELLPLSPNKEGWIAVETEKPKIGERVLTFSDDQISLPQMRVAVIDEDNRFWIGINNILCVTHWQPLPPAPTRNTCQTCGKEITGSGYCSKECSNEGFGTELPIQL